MGLSYSARNTGVTTELVGYYFLYHAYSQRLNTESKLNVGKSDT